MKKNFNYYRLINNKALQFLQQEFYNKLRTWNQNYFVEPINNKLTYALKIENFNEHLLLKTAEKPLALFDKEYLSFFKKIIFADESDCFNQVCNEIFLCFITQLLDLESIELIENSTNEMEWIYSGTSCLILSLINNNNFLNFYLHPEWTLNHFPRSNSPVKSLVNLDETLAKKSIELTLCLEPIYLHLDKLSQLQVGDLIKTEHLLTNPLLLKYQNQACGQADLGQFEHYKSIQLLRSK